MIPQNSSKTNQNQAKIPIIIQPLASHDLLRLNQIQNSRLKLFEEDKKRNESNKSLNQFSPENPGEIDLIQDRKEKGNINNSPEKNNCFYQVSDKKRSKIKIKRKSSLNPYRNIKLNTINILFGKKTFEKLRLSKIFKRKNIEIKSDSYEIFIGRKNIKFFEEFGFFNALNNKMDYVQDFQILQEQNIDFENELLFNNDYHNVNDEKINTEIIAGMSSNHQRNNSGIYLPNLSINPILPFTFNNSTNDNK